MAITWQNVSAPDGANLIRQVGSAYQNIAGSIGLMGDVVGQVQKTNDTYEQQPLMEMLNSARSLEDIEALQQSGQVDALREAMGMRSQMATRGALDARTNAIHAENTAQMTREEAALQAGDRAILRGNNAYVQTQVEKAREQQPLKDAYASQIALGQNLDDVRNKVAQDTSLTDDSRTQIITALSAAANANKVQARNDKLNESGDAVTLQGNTNKVLEGQLTQEGLQFNNSPAAANIGELVRTGKIEDAFALANSLGGTSRNLALTYVNREIENNRAEGRTKLLAAVGNSAKGLQGELGTYITEYSMGRSTFKPEQAVSQMVEREVTLGNIPNTVEAKRALHAELIKSAPSKYRPADAPEGASEETKAAVKSAQEAYMYGAYGDTPAVSNQIAENNALQSQADAQAASTNIFLRGGGQMRAANVVDVAKVIGDQLDTDDDKTSIQPAVQRAANKLYKTSTHPNGIRAPMGILELAASQSSGDVDDFKDLVEQYMNDPNILNDLAVAQGIIARRGKDAITSSVTPK